MNATETEMVQSVRELSRKNYSKAHGWQVIAECMTDAEIAQSLSVARMRSIGGAQRWARSAAAMHTDAYVGY